MVGSKGSGNTDSMRWMSGQLYSEGDGRFFTLSRFDRKRTYLTAEQLYERCYWDRSFGRKPRIRVKAGRQPW
jgi:hypothetical protein